MRNNDEWFQTEILHQLLTALRNESSADVPSAQRVEIELPETMEFFIEWLTRQAGRAYGFEPASYSDAFRVVLTQAARQGQAAQATAQGMGDDDWLELAPPALVVTDDSNTLVTLRQALQVIPADENLAIYEKTAIEYMVERTGANRIWLTVGCYEYRIASVRVAFEGVTQGIIRRLRGVLVGAQQPQPQPVVEATPQASIAPVAPTQTAVTAKRRTNPGVMAHADAIARLQDGQARTANFYQWARDYEDERGSFTEKSTPAEELYRKNVWNPWKKLTGKI